MLYICFNTVLGCNFLFWNFSSTEFDGPKPLGTLGSIVCFSTNLFPGCTPPVRDRMNLRWRRVGLPSAVVPSGWWWSAGQPPTTPRCRYGWIRRSTPTRRRCDVNIQTAQRYCQLNLGFTVGQKNVRHKHFYSDSHALYFVLVFSRSWFLRFLLRPH